MNTESNLIDKPPQPGLRRTLYEIIFEHDTPKGKLFDVGLLVAILLSVLAVMLDSVADIRHLWANQLRIVEWVFTIIFTAEYVCRIYCSERPRRYVLSFFGVVDFLAIIPTYLSLFLIGSQYLIVIRAFRLLRIFRVLKMTRYIGEEDVLLKALAGSRRKITVFLISVLNAVVIIGALMHLIEGPENGFTSIPRGIYWAVVTLTTVGYGDVAPATLPGQALAVVVMILGYGIIAVPTGIVTSELSRSKEVTASVPSGQRCCERCASRRHDFDAVYCKLCGNQLPA